MSHNKSREITAMIEPCPTSPGFLQDLSIHSPEYQKNNCGVPLVEAEAVRISLSEAADYAVNWMTQLYYNTPSDYRILKFQTKDEVADHSAFVVRMEKILGLVNWVAFEFVLQTESSGGGVMLMTNDKALSLEAEIEGIQTLRIHPGFNCRTLLEIFDPILVKHIDQLVAEIPFDQMTMFKICKTHCNLRDTAIQCVSRGSVVRSKLKKSTNALDPKQPICDNEIMMTPAGGPLSCSKSPLYEPEEDEDMADIILPPSFPEFKLDMLTISTLSHLQDLLDLHQHISQAVASLMQKPHFDHISTFKSLSDLTDLYRMCNEVLDRCQIHLISQDIKDATQWTASDCLVIINECWVDGCCELFNDRLTFQASPPRPNLPYLPSVSQSVLPSRWAPSAAKPNPMPVLSRNVLPNAQHLIRLRKVVQVLATQLRPFPCHRLPRDNPTSWSELLWEGLIEDCRDILRFFIPTDSGVPSSLHDCLEKGIESWDLEAHRLCRLRSTV
ncbi:hypothetical protein CROQUDRAFT_111568 [Cronartium quercuum f. sp. fusiforme G11]|uniref:Uncharacterized protein n=1 Tax=Cronartium quercuum f. sp. fusiforme G11 TaxID=708437 RepID=A0A9P6N878_9BASI|nr:hypothetical protein CROQUDRAFT_111568 [Cronartium quercuum f. sp. fusiforme G11]